MSIASDLGIGSLQLNTAPDIHWETADWRWNPSPMPDYDFWFIMAGSVYVELNGCSLKGEKGDCFLWRPGDAPICRQSQEHPVRVFFGHFSPLNSEQKPVEAPRLPYPVRLRDADFFEVLAHRVQRYWQRGDNNGRDCAKDLMLLMLWQLWDETNRNAGPRDEVMEGILRFMRSEPERRWGVDELAQRCHLSRAQFSRRFRATTGTSPNRFLIGLRVESAKNLLIETDLTLDRIALKLGYEDVHYFSRQFFQVVGVWPGQYQRGRRKWPTS